MTSRPRAAALGLALLTLSLLAAPGGTADGVHVLASRDLALPSVPGVDPRLVPQEAGAELGWGCDEYTSNWDPGRIAITGRGTFSTIGQLTDGCGLKGCDDQIEGDLYVESRQEWLPFKVMETRDPQGACVAYCYVKTRAGILSGYGGKLDFTNDDKVSYSCSGEDGWIFSGSQAPPEYPYPPPYELPFAQW